MNMRYALLAAGLAAAIGGYAMANDVTDNIKKQALMQPTNVTTNMTTADRSMTTYKIDLKRLPLGYEKGFIEVRDLKSTDGKTHESIMVNLERSQKADLSDMVASPTGIKTDKGMAMKTDDRSMAQRYVNLLDRDGDGKLTNVSFGEHPNNRWMAKTDKNLVAQWQTIYNDVYSQFKQN